MLSNSCTKRNQKDNMIIRVDDLWHRQQKVANGCLLMHRNGKEAFAFIEIELV